MKETKKDTPSNISLVTIEHSEIEGTEFRLARKRLRRLGHARVGEILAGFAQRLEVALGWDAMDTMILAFEAIPKGKGTEVARSALGGATPHGPACPKCGAYIHSAVSLEPGANAYLFCPKDSCDYREEGKLDGTS